MFSGLVDQFRKDIDGVKAVVRWQEDLRVSIHLPGNGGATTIALDDAALQILRARAPAKLPWQVFDHYAAVTRIYALYEKAICDLVDSYLGYLAKNCPGYGLLHERVRIQHRVGVGYILAKWSNSPTSLYSNLAERDLAAGLADGLRGTPYKLLSEAFLVDSDNFRAGPLGRLFNSLGFDNAFAWVKKYDPIVNFCQTNLSGAETPESFLDGFVRARNEAAHGNITNLASINEIANYADFTVLVLEAFAALLRTHLIKCGLTTGNSVEIGRVLHTWSNNVAGVEAIANYSIRQNEKLYVGSKNIVPVTIMSLRIGQVEHAALDLTPTTQFGLRLDSHVSVGASLFKWNLT